jgi:DNA helicase INO80
LIRQNIYFHQVQDIVVGNKHFTDVAKPSEIVQLLLNDAQLAGLNNALPAKEEGKQPQANSEQEHLRDLWNEEGDDFFNQSTSLAATTSDIVKEDDRPSGTSTVRKKRGKGAGSTLGTRKHTGPRSVSSAKQTANHEAPSDHL